MEISGVVVVTDIWLYCPDKMGTRSWAGGAKGEGELAPTNRGRPAGPGILLCLVAK